jgi:hypothetical protein
MNADPVAADTTTPVLPSDEFCHLRRVLIPCGSLVSFKLFPTSSDPFNHDHHESSSLWSAFYGQFTVKNAVRYLSNHYDRGCSSVTLYAVEAVQELSAMVYKNQIMQQSCSSAEKATAFCRDINTWCSRNGLEKAFDPQGSGSVVSQVGSKLDAVLVLLDADDYEIAFPHQHFCPQHFRIIPIFEIHQKESPCVFSGPMTDGVTVVDTSTFVLLRELTLTKSQKQDSVELADRLQQLVAPNYCAWVEGHI